MQPPAEPSWSSGASSPTPDAEALAGHVGRSSRTQQYLSQILLLYRAPFKVAFGGIR